MKQLNEFCHLYLPQYFVLVFKDRKLKPHIFDYKNKQNVFQLTSEMFQLMDILFTSNPQLQPSEIIDKYFIFEKHHEFQKNQNEIEEVENYEARQRVRQILKKMKEINRMSYQIFMRLAYLYFYHKEIKEEKQSESKKSTGEKEKKQKKDNKENHEYKDNKGRQYQDQIIIYYQEMKFLTMTEDDSFLVMDFMEYIIRLLLDIKPNAKFLDFINKLIVDCNFTEKYVQKVQQKINELQIKVASSSSINKLKNTTSRKIGGESNQSQIQEPKQQNTPRSKPKKNDSTPVKQRSANKSQQKTLQTSQKKERIVNKKGQDIQNFEQLKKTLSLKDKPSTFSKERTIYARKRYIIPKKVHNFNDQNSSTGSNQNNNEDLFIIDINRTFSSRCLELQDVQEEDFLVGATPKPKKKVKLEKTHTGTFDNNGNFVKGLF